MNSGGVVYMTPQFPRNELKADDFNGGCVFGEISASLTWGAAGYAMWFGMNTSMAAAGIMNPLARAAADHSATGVLLFHGNNYGFQAGVGAASFVGYMRGQ